MPALVGPARSALLLLAAAVAALAGLRYAALHLPSLPSLLPGASPAAHRRHGAGMAPAAVVVVGGGLAGASAALAAAEAVPSARVVLLEKEPRPGGNSMKASSGMNALAEAQGDSATAFREDTLASGGGRAVPELVDALVVGREGGGGGGG